MLLNSCPEQHEINSSFNDVFKVLRDDNYHLIDAITMHSPEIRGLCLMKWSSETLQNLPYFFK